MVVRDLAIEEQLPTINQLNYSILAYKGGNSVYQYITEKYGREKNWRDFPANEKNLRMQKKDFKMHWE